MSESHTTIPTPSPRERSLVVLVEESVFANNPNILPPERTLYSECPKELFAKEYDKDKWGTYMYVEQHGDHGLLFVKTKTPEQRNTQIRPTQKVTGRVSWDAVLEWLQFGKESGFPLSQTTINGQGQQAIVTAERWLVPRGYRPAQNLMTTIEIQQYLSEVPWPDWAMESDEPQPTEVMWDLVGSHGSMGRCLHPEVKVPAQSTSGYRVVTSAGAIQSANATGTREWTFPKTNHSKRRDYTVVEVKYVDGQYLRTVFTFRVPTTQSKIIQQS